MELVYLRCVNGCLTNTIQSTHRLALCSRAAISFDSPSFPLVSKTIGYAIQAVMIFIPVMSTSVTYLQISNTHSKCTTCISCFGLRT